MRLSRLLPFALLATLLTAQAARAQESPAGTWTGTISGEGDPIAVTLTLGEDASNRLEGRATDASGESHPLQNISLEGTTLSFAIPGLPGEPIFSGDFRGDSIDGTASLAPPPPPPSTDVYLIALEGGTPTWAFGSPTNITDRDGYDNQPHFLLDDSALLYTSIRDGQADIYHYDLSTRRARQLTDTPESEYSPTPLPSGDGFSTVRVEADGTQRLWSFDLSGEEPALLLESVAPVGYHGWLDGHRLGLFVLGSPPTLQLAEIGTQSSIVKTNSIGRSIHRTPDGTSITFVSKPPDAPWTIDSIELDSPERRTLVATPEGSEDFTWSPDGSLVTGRGSLLYVARPDESGYTWREAVNLESSGIRNITRLDVSNDFRWLAVVGERPQAPAPRQSRPFALSRMPSG